MAVRGMHEQYLISVTAVDAFNHDTNISVIRRQMSLSFVICTLCERRNITMRALVECLITCSGAQLYVVHIRCTVGDSWCSFALRSSATCCGGTQTMPTPAICVPFVPTQIEEVFLPLPSRALHRPVL